MIAFINGELVPLEQARVSVVDRGFMYGDGLFEAIRACGGQLVQWTAHFERLQRGADFLRIPIPYSSALLEKFVRILLDKNRASEGIMRLTLSRGPGARGYSLKDAGPPTLVLTLHAIPPAPAGRGWKTIFASLRCRSDDPLVRLKTCNRLPQILARREAEEQEMDEAIFLNEHGHVTEGTRSNIFWLRGNHVCTAPLASGLLAGTTRGLVAELCQECSLSFGEENLHGEELGRADGVFATLTSAGLVPIESIGEERISIHPAMKQLQKAYALKLGLPC